MKRRSKCSAAATIAALVSVVGTASARAQSAPKAADPELTVLVGEAVAEFNAGHWAEAHALFARAYAQQPNARVARGLGLAAFELRRYVEAVRALRAALEDSRHALTADQRSEVSAALDRARRYVGQVTVEVVPSDAQLLLDGRVIEERELTLDVGDYQLGARAAHHKEAQVRLNVEGGQTRAVRLELVRLDAPEPQAPPRARPGAIVEAPPDSATAPAEDPGFAQRVLGFTGIGLGAAGLVTGLVFELQRSSKLSERDAICPTSRNCTRDEAADIDRLTGEARTASTVSLIGWIAGGVFTAAGIALVLTAESSDAGPTVAFVPHAGRDGAGLTMRVVGL